MNPSTRPTLLGCASGADGQIVVMGFPFDHGTEHRMGSHAAPGVLRAHSNALGLREGWLYDQLPKAERYHDPLVDGAQLYGLLLARIPRFAPALVAWTDGLFPGEPPAEKRLRVAACALSDIAWRDHPDVRAEESFRRNLAAAQEQGELSPDVDVDALAKFLTALDMGLISYGIVAPNPTDRARIISVLDRVLC